MEGLNLWRSEDEPLVRRPPGMGSEPGSSSLAAAKPLLTEGFVDEGASGFAAGVFFRISSYKSRIKSSLNRPNVEHAAVKPERFDWSMANWHTFRARRSFGVIKFSTLNVSRSHNGRE